MAEEEALARAEADTGRSQPGEKIAPPENRPLWAAVILVAFVLAFAAFAFERMFPPQPYGLADDWRVFYAAGGIALHGGNPYATALIHRAEQHADFYRHVQPSLDDYVNPPVVALALGLFTFLPFWGAFALFSALGAGSGFFLLWLLLRKTGWALAPVWAGLAAFSWISLLGFFSGQLDFFLLGGVCGAVLLAARGRWLATAVVMAIVMIKPDLLWPLPFLIATSFLPDWQKFRRFLLASVAVGMVLMGIGEAAMPGSTIAFLKHLILFGKGIETVQPDIAGLSGLFQPFAFSSYATIGIALAGVVAVAAVCITGARSQALQVLPQRTRVLLTVGAGMTVWMLATPYAHPNDDIMLLPFLAVVVGRNAALITNRLLGIAIGLCLVLMLLFFTVPAAGGLVAAIIALTLLLARARVPQGFYPNLALASMLLLPMVWPFHISPVSLTPMAVASLAAAFCILYAKSAMGSWDARINFPPVLDNPAGLR